MPIKIPEKLPARATLEQESIFVMTERRAVAQDIRPLKILILNLMPTKISTETQLLRCLSNSPLQVEIELLQTSSYKATHISEDHLISFYTTFDRVLHRKYDGLIITGAPIETLPFRDVAYWDELTDIMRWSTTHVQSTFHICWGAQAGLFYHHGIEKYPLPEKKFGIFPHNTTNEFHPLTRGFDEIFFAPHSRHTTVRREDIAAVPSLKILADSDSAGVFLIATPDGRQVFVTGHPEYDADTLAAEYFRDKDKGQPVPENYFPQNNPQKAPPMLWRSHAHLLYTNWLNYCVYQEAPYDLAPPDGAEDSHG